MIIFIGAWRGRTVFNKSEWGKPKVCSDMIALSAQTILCKQKLASSLRNDITGNINWMVLGDCLSIRISITCMASDVGLSF